MALPTIQSAIPKRRYQYGEFLVTLLTEINSQDNINYLYMMAILTEGSAQPEAYITCETIKLEEKTSYRVRVLSPQSEQIISESSEWRIEHNFCEFALQGIQQMFNLKDEKPIVISS